MIPIACSILSANFAKTEDAIGICSSAIFYKENPQNTILGPIILAGK
jgi:hypothetical protein